ncbi:7-cyano-7-deazaguanine synthase QueC [Desulfosporosinus sp. FKA]|uniref:7-cyano-7-deazaguanine synthase QueC n=1 Tax=Desulfosporosinus sp. FKA TaxID=1969834 RepID=UPI000B4978DB|nr:7-cyano-7-deazaguanine synthase QueC [Desulfosporosinus sp. FKA]
MAGIVLLSGGLDSTVAMALFLEKTTLDLAITFDYGQRAKEKEISASRQIADHFNIRHTIIALPFLQEQTRTALVNRSTDLPQLEFKQLDNIEEEALESAHQVWVPNRNGLFMNIAAVYAENMGEAVTLITGFNREEAATFPDNSLEFMTAMNDCFKYSTQNTVTVDSPTAALSKSEIVREGLRLNIPFEKVWSCYENGQRPCGHCESCLRMKRALIANKAEALVSELFDTP